MASFSIVDYDDVTVTIRVTGLDSGQTVRFFVRLADDTSDSKIDKNYTASGSSLRKTFGNLDPETDYAVNVCVDGTWLGKQTFTTTKPRVERPDDWSFYSTISSGSKIKLTASEWNDFCDRINEFRVYCGLSQYDFTYAQKGRPISASIVNQARTAIKSIPQRGTLPSSVSSGDVITARFFNRLESALNAIP